MPDGRLEGPEFAALLDVDLGLGDGFPFGPGIGRAHGDPLLEGLDFERGELALGGHLEVLVLVADRMEQQAFLGLAGNDGGSGVAAGLPAGHVVEPEAALDLLLSRMAFVAFFDQQGADLGFEEGEALAGLGVRSRNEQQGNRRENKPTDGRAYPRMRRRRSVGRLCHPWGDSGILRQMREHCSERCLSRFLHESKY